MDFTTTKYKILLQQLVTNDFKCTIFAGYIQNSHSKPESLELVNLRRNLMLRKTKN